MLTTKETIRADELLYQQLISTALSYAILFCSTLEKVTITVDEDPSAIIFSFLGAGLKPRQVSKLDLKLPGYICQAIIRSHKGKILQVEELDNGCRLQFRIPANSVL